MAAQACDVNVLMDSAAVPFTQFRKEMSGGQVVEFQPASKTAMPPRIAMRPAGHLQVETIRTGEARLNRLRCCEDLFFSFAFPELVRQSDGIIEQGTEFGDAYAFRCFAFLGQIQLGVVGEEDHDLVEFLRDYFDACERPLLTEGATVCRLFLKLVFGDLVKRIARAEPGTRFALDKTDPVCGGAFAVFDGDFSRARQRFDAAIADPASRVYALAGIALLKMFDCDLQGAVAAFTLAGAGDGDIVKLWSLLQA